MANIYHLGNVLTRPVGESVTEEIEVAGRSVTLTLTNHDDLVELKVSGQSEIDDLCARCGVSVKLPIVFDTTFKVKDEATDDEIEDGVIVMDRHAGIDLDQIVLEAVELARPTITYCPKHEEKSPKPFVIE